MIQLQNIALAFGGQVILDRLTWTVKPGRRIGLIGPNGAGKTTLLRVMAGLQEVDGGEVAQIGEVGYLAQDAQEITSERTVLDEALQAFDAVLALQEEEHRITEALEAEPDHESARYQKLLHALERVHAELVTKEIHLIRPRTEAVLTGVIRQRLRQRALYRLGDTARTREVVGHGRGGALRRCAPLRRARRLLSGHRP